MVAVCRLCDVPAELALAFAEEFRQRVMEADKSEIRSGIITGCVFDTESL